MDLSDATGKIPATPGTDPETFRFVAQCLKHYATSGPSRSSSSRVVVVVAVIIIIIIIIIIIMPFHTDLMDFV